MSENTTKSSKPTHHASVKIGHGKQAEFQTVGVGWAREDGGINVQVYGKQIIEGIIYVTPKKEES